MPKTLFYVVLLASFAWTQSLGFKPKDSKLAELSADQVEKRGDDIIAKGNVILISGDYYISAEDLIYNQKTKIGYIDGEARIYQGNNLLLSAKKIKMDFGGEHFNLSSLYLQNNTTGLWISAAQSESKDGIYYFKEGSVSGCDIQNPIWHFDASSGSFNQKDQFLTLWNVRAYLGKMPFLYIPYVSVSTNNQRKSGLLYPDIAYIDQEGFYYEQPIFIASYESWDITLSPQIRSARGAGFSAEFRLATPKDNLFYFGTKYFYNFNKYIQKYAIKNQNIYGFEMLFQTHSGTGMFKDNFAFYDGFFVDFSYMNDIDYLRIDDVGKNITDRIRVSKVNYFFRSQDHYAGLYNKYFFDFSSLNNQETFQLLPSVQYHKFLDSFFFKNLMYSIDIQTNNVIRPRGYGYVENSITLPLGVEFPLFNNYISLGLSTDFNFTNVNFYLANEMIVPGGDKPEKSANFFTANYAATLTSDIARDYGKVLHTMRFGAKVSGPYYRYNTRMFDARIYKAYQQAINSTQQIYNLWNPLSIVDFEANKPIFEFQFSQYFYLPDGNTAFFYNASQKLNLESKDLLFSSSMFNEIGTSPINGLSLKGNLYYSFLYRDIESASVNFDFTRWRLDGSLGYYYKNVFVSNNINVDANFLNFRLKNDFGYFAFGGELNYDFINTQVKDWSFTLSTDIRCFGISFKFGQEFSPMIVDRPNHPIETITNNYVKVEFRVIPLGSLGASYRFKK